MELRCTSTIHAVIVDAERIEVKCSSRRCGAHSGTVVFHYFDRSSGELVETRKFQDPKKLFESNQERTS